MPDDAVADPNMALVLVPDDPTPDAQSQIDAILSHTPVETLHNPNVNADGNPRIEYNSYRTAIIVDGEVFIG